MRLLLSLLVFAWTGDLAAQSVLGTVRSADGPVPGARVESGDRSTVARPDGRFLLSGLAPGRHTVRVSALGYVTRREVVQVGAGETRVLDVDLEVSAVPVDPIVVTGTMRETRVSESPVKVDVVSARRLQRTPSTNLMESIGQINGLTQQVDCGVCYTNSIRINGMEGPYTAVLIDGMPIMGALASVYGLNGIDPALVERLEILKGPQSTLYGTEAMGGVVNVITTDPRFAPRWAVDASYTSLGEGALRLAAAPDGERVSGLVSASLLHNDRFVDDNGDGFSDLTLDTRLSVFAKGELRDGDGREVAALTGKLYHEDRFGGVEAWTTADRGSDRIYGEAIRTRRVELMGRARAPWPGVAAAVSWAWHDQDSWYGDQGFMADQHVVFGQLLWDPGRRGAHDLLFGTTLRLDVYDDDTPATAGADRRLVPGVFVQDEWRIDQGWTALGGLRLDHHDEHGPIFAPRAALQWRPTAETTVRLNAGTGFRVVHLFTEDHAALTGAREVVIDGDLDPERSWSVAANLNHVVEFGANPMMVDVDLFHTRFSNRIQPDYDVSPDLIVYRNLDGHAVTRGVALSFNQNFDRIPFLYSVGVTLQEVTVERDGLAEKDFFAPDFKGVWSLAYTFADRLTLDWTGTMVGPMRLPEYDEPHARPTRSEPFTTHDVQARWRSGGRELYLAVRNAGDFTQGSPLVAPDEPFGEAFDTNYVWGPVVGRRIVVGVRLTEGR